MTEIEIQAFLNKWIPRLYGIWTAGMLEMYLIFNCERFGYCYSNVPIFESSLIDICIFVVMIITWALFLSLGSYILFKWLDNKSSGNFTDFFSIFKLIKTKWLLPPLLIIGGVIAICELLIWIF